MKKIGKEVLFIGAKGNNPRNGEGAFIRLKNGDILFGYTEYIGNNDSDDANARIAAVISHDEGESFSESRVLFDKPEGTKNIMSLSFLRMGNGDIGAFYIVKNADGTDKIVLRRSADEGESWDEGISCMDCLPEQDYFVLNNDRVLRLKSGRIIFSVARHSVKAEKGRFMPGVLCFFISDDDGRSFRKTEVEFSSPFPNDNDGYQEPGLYEFADGTLWCYNRTGLGHQFTCRSADEGESWSTPAPDYFFSSPCSPMLVKKISGLTLAVFNPVPAHLLRSPAEPWGRTPYVLAVSNDDGKSFCADRLFYIEDDLSNGYCYPAMIEVDGGFLLAYYHSDNTGFCLKSQRIKKIMLDELK